MIKKIISGGQTGVDRAALDAAISLGILHGGWCPNGRRAEDGIIPDKYKLRETVSRNYLVRTKMNLTDSDGTLLIYRGKLGGGSLATRHEAKELNRPIYPLNLDTITLYTDFVKIINNILNWINKNKIEILNVAGPRASKQPEIYKQAKSIVKLIIIYNTNYI